MSSKLVENRAALLFGAGWKNRVFVIHSLIFKQKWCFPQRNGCSNQPPQVSSPPKEEEIRDEGVKDHDYWQKLIHKTYADKRRCAASWSLLGHQTLIRNRLFVLTMPWWPSCAKSSSSLLRLWGITILVLRITIFPSKQSSFFTLR